VASTKYVVANAAGFGLPKLSLMVPGAIVALSVPSDERPVMVNRAVVKPLRNVTALTKVPLIPERIKSVGTTDAGDTASLKFTSSVAVGSVRMPLGNAGTVETTCIEVV